MKIFAALGLLGSLALAGAATAAATPVLASEDMPAASARRLDAQPAQFTASAAKMRRMMIIQENMERQNGYRNRGYASRHGYGPRPVPGPGYGPRPGYGRPGYGYPGRSYGPPRY